MEASAASTISARIGEPRWLPNRADIWHVLSALITHGLSTSMAECLLTPRRINSHVWTRRHRDCFPSAANCGAAWFLERLEQSRDGKEFVMMVIDDGGPYNLQ